jgi:archaellum biogenesis protein FlaJ (TadC family)
MLESMASNPFEGTTIDIGAILSTVPPEVFANNTIIIFVVLIIHCLMLALTIRTLRGSHGLMTLFYFVPFVWIVAITSVGINISLGGYLGL